MNIEYYAKKIFGFALSKTNNFQDAEDLSQEILISLYKSSEKIRDVENVDAYVYKICSYTWSNYLRKEKRHWNNLNADENMCSHQYNPINEIIEEQEKKETLMSLRKEIAYMNKLYREILVKKYYENKSIKQISKELYISEGTIKWYIHDAKGKLKEEVKMREINNIESMRPIKLKVGYSGTPGIDNEPNVYFRSLLNQNICYIAYEEPLLAEEIAKKLQVATAFVEEAIEELECGELIKKVGKKYQTAFIIKDLELSIKLLDIIIEKSEEVAMKIYYCIKNSMNEIREIAPLWNDISENILMWSIYPYFVNCILEETRDYREFMKYDASEKKDGGKYVVSASIKDKEFYENTNREIYIRHKSLGIKTRGDYNRIFSHQVDSYFQGLIWREFNGDDAINLSRICENIKRRIEFNEFDKILVSNYAEQGYLKVEDEKVKFKFPIMNMDQLEKINNIIRVKSIESNIYEELSGVTEKIYYVYKKQVPKSINDRDIRVISKSNAMGIVIGCMEYLERMGILEIPSEEDKKAMSTVVSYNLEGM